MLTLLNTLNIPVMFFTSNGLTEDVAFSYHVKIKLLHQLIECGAFFNLRIIYNVKLWVSISPFVSCCPILLHDKLTTITFIVYIGVA